MLLTVLGPFPDSLRNIFLLFFQDFPSTEASGVSAGELGSSVWERS